MAIEILLPERQQGALAHLSAQTGRSADELVIEAIDRMLEHERWFDAQVQVGLDQIAGGEFVDESAMDERFAKLLKS